MLTTRVLTASSLLTGVSGTSLEQEALIIPSALDEADLNSSNAASCSPIGWTWRWILSMGRLVTPGANPIQAALKAECAAGPLAASMRPPTAIGSGET